MKVKMITLNELYCLHERGNLDAWKKTATKEEFQQAYEILMSEGLVGTCLETEDSILFSYGFSTDEFDDKIGQDNRLSIYDELVMDCPVCGWNISPQDGDNCEPDEEDEK